MKTAIYIEDGVVQLVLTPESDFEHNALASFASKSTEMQIFHGSFYDCRGGWTRQSDFMRQSETDRSMIVRVSKKQQTEEQP